MYIALTKFAIDRHFEGEKGSRIHSHTPSSFEESLSAYVEAGKVRWADGYAPFCKHIFVRNFTGALLGDVEITPENKHLLHSGYEARREGELPVLTRWFVREELEAEGFEVPVAPWLDVIVYSEEQLDKEAEVASDVEKDIVYADWGIVAVLAVPTDEEPPMTPVTALRNALGIKEGGSGAPLDRPYYNKCVDYWSTHALVR